MKIKNIILSLLFINILFNKLVYSRLNKKVDYSKKFIIGYSKTNELDFYNNYIKWDSIDAIVLPTYLSNLQKIINIAQSNNVMGLLNIEGNTLNDDLIDQYVNQVIDLQADGISLIFYKNPTSDKNYLQKVEKLGDELKGISKNIHFSVSISIKNYPYSYEKLNKIDYVDYVIANAYDMGNFIGKVSQNSPTQEIRNEIQKWKKTKKTNSNKIILSVSWFGYEYECDEFPNDLYTFGCVNSRNPRFVEYKEIYDYLNGNHVENKQYIASAELWNQNTLNPFLNLRKNNTNESSSGPYSYHQIQYDNPMSTYFKIRNTGIGGIGIYSLDSLYGLNKNDIQSMYLSINKNLI